MGAERLTHRGTFPTSRRHYGRFVSRAGAQASERLSEGGRARRHNLAPSARVSATGRGSLLRSRVTAVVCWCFGSKHSCTVSPRCTAEGKPNEDETGRALRAGERAQKPFSCSLVALALLQQCSSSAIATLLGSTWFVSTRRMLVSSLSPTSIHPNNLHDVLSPSQAGLYLIFILQLVPLTSGTSKARSTSHHQWRQINDLSNTFPTDQCTDRHKARPIPKALIINDIRQSHSTSNNNHQAHLTKRNSTSHVYDSNYVHSVYANSNSIRLISRATSSIEIDKSQHIKAAQHNSTAAQYISIDKLHFSSYANSH